MVGVNIEKILSDYQYPWEPFIEDLTKALNGEIDKIVFPKNHQTPAMGDFKNE